MGSRHHVMGRREMSSVGELETLILFAILRIGSSAYGVSIQDEIAARTGRRLSRGAIYTATGRLEAKCFITSTMGEATAARGGRAKRYLSVTDEGLEVLRSTTRDLDRMRAGVTEVPVDA